MDTFIKIAQFILSLSLLVLIHELGHFTFAKIFKTRVEKFYLFFNPWFSLYKFKKGETTYGLGWLPLGGYVKIAGMIDESFDKEQLKNEPQPWEFRSKKLGQRFLIMFGGVLFNFLLAWIIYSSMLVVWGESYLPMSSLKDGVWCINPKAKEIGFKNGDKIISINNKTYENFGEMSQDIIYGGEVKVQRDGKDTIINIKYSDIAKLIEDQSGLLFYPRVPMIVGAIPDTSINSKSGLIAKDQIIAIDGIPIHYFDQFGSAIKSYKGKEVSITVLRESSRKEIKIKVSESGYIEITPAIYEIDELSQSGLYKMETIEYSVLSSIPAGIIRAKETLSKYIKQFKLIFKIDGAYKSVGGFISMGSIFPSEWIWSVFWELTALLSVILAFMNFLPIPALDGGHIMFLVYELIARKKPSEAFLERAQMFGMAILLTLLLFANGNDIIKQFMN